MSEEHEQSTISPPAAFPAAPLAPAPLAPPIDPASAGQPAEEAAPPAGETVPPAEGEDVGGGFIGGHPEVLAGAGFAAGFALAIALRRRVGR